MSSLSAAGSESRGRVMTEVVRRRCESCPSLISGGNEAQVRWGAKGTPRGSGASSGRRPRKKGCSGSRSLAESKGWGVYVSASEKKRSSSSAMDGGGIKRTGGVISWVGWQIHESGTWKARERPERGGQGREDRTDKGSGVG